MIIARESAAGLESSTDIADMLSNAVPSLGTECTRSPVKKLDGEKNSLSVCTFHTIKNCVYD